MGLSAAQVQGLPLHYYFMLVLDARGKPLQRKSRNSTPQFTLS